MITAPHATPALEQHITSDNGAILSQSSGMDREKTTEPELTSNEHSDGGGKSTLASGDEYEYVTGFKLAIVIGAVTLVAFLMMLDTSIIATAIPRITSDFHSLSDVGWYGSAYLLASCSIQPLTGKFYTYFSSKFTFLTFLAIFELGSLVCGVATSSKMLIVGRAFAGMGTSGLSNGALTIISACVPLERRPVYLGIMMGVAQIGIVLGPLLGGVLTEYSTWRWCFYINLPAGGAAAILLVLIHIPDRTVKSDTKSTLHMTLAKLDLIGFALFAPGAIQLLLALEWGGTRYSWSSATIIGLFCGAAITLGIFMAWEYRKGDTAMMPLSMIRRRIVWCSCLVIGFFMGSMMITSYYLPIYFQAVRDATPALSAVYLLPQILSQMIFAVTSGILVGKMGYYLPWIIFGSILTSLGTGLISTFTPTTPTGTWIGYQILAGAGRGCGLQMPIVAIQNCLPQEQVSVGMSLVIFSQTFGGSLFLALAQTVFTSGLVKGLSVFAPQVSAKTILQAGATAIRKVVPQSEIAGVLLAYNQAISHDFYLAAGAAAATFVFGWGMGWKSIKKAKAKVSEP